MVGCFLWLIGPTAASTALADDDAWCHMHVNHTGGDTAEEDAAVEQAAKEAGVPVPGPRVLLLDESDDWKGAGTALYMAERGLRVSFLTKGVLVAKGLISTKTHKALRKRFKELGVEGIVQSALVSWSGGAATIKHLVLGETEPVRFDTLVLSTTNAAEEGLQAALAESGIEVQAIGDCVAPRTAAAAIHEGRRLALAL